MSLFLVSFMITFPSPPFVLFVSFAIPLCLCLSLFLYFSLSFTHSLSSKVVSSPVSYLSYTVTLTALQLSLLRTLTHLFALSASGGCHYERRRIRRKIIEDRK